MSDDLTDRIAEALARRVSCGATGDRYLVGGDARPLLAEARDEITRLNAHVEQLLNACDAADEAISMQTAQAERLRALLGTPSTEGGE